MMPSLLSARSWPRFLALFCCGLALTVPGLAQGRQTKGEKPLSIAQGQQVNLADFLVTNRTTIFIFTTEYHAACRMYNEPLLVLHQRGTNLAVVKVNINRPEYHEIDWDSPVAQQYALATKGLPHFKVFGPDGKLMVEGPEARLQVNDWIAEIK